MFVAHGNLACMSKATLTCNPVHVVQRAAFRLTLMPKDFCNATDVLILSRLVLGIIISLGCDGNYEVANNIEHFKIWHLTTSTY